MSEVIKYTTDHGEVTLSPDIIRKYLVSGGGNVTNQEIMMFLALCKYQQLNPFLREAYLIKYSDSQPATMVVGKDVFTKRAANNDTYNGTESGIVVYDNEDKELIYREGTLILNHEILVGGWAKGWRKNWDKPVYITVNLSEYIGKKRDGSINRQWKQMPTTMIRKVALVQMLRELFPDQFQGLYDASEMRIDSKDMSEDIIQEPKPVEGAEEIDATREELDNEKRNRKENKGNRKIKRDGKVEKEGAGEESQNDETPRETPETENQTEVDKKIADLARGCRTGLEIMSRKGYLTSEELANYEHEINEYIEGNAVEFLVNLYKDLGNIYREKEKAGSK